MNFIQNKRQYLIDWVNSLDIPSCIFVNDISDLFDGKILSEIIYFFNQSFKASEPTLDQINQFMQKEYNYTFEIRHQSQEQIENEATSLLAFLNLISENSASNASRYNKNNSNNNVNSNDDNKNCTNTDKGHMITQSQNFYIANTDSNMNSEKKKDDNDNDNDNDNEQYNKENEEGEKDEGDKNEAECNDISIKYKPSTILDNQIIMGNHKMIKDFFNCNNSQTELYYYKFFKPTVPVFSCDINARQYTRVNLFNMAINKKEKAEMSEEYLIYSAEEDKESAQLRSEKKEFVLEVLYDYNFIKENQKTFKYLNEIFLPNAYDGIFIAELINTIEGNKDKLIRGIFKETYIKKHITLNYKKIYNHLYQTDSFKSDFLFQNEEIFKSDKGKLFDFIYEIIIFYMKNRQLLYNKMKRSKQMSKKAFRKAYSNFDNNNSYYDMNSINDKNHLWSVYHETVSSKHGNKKESPSMSNMMTQSKEAKNKWRSEMDDFENKRKCFIVNSRINIENQKINSHITKMTQKQENDIIDIKKWLREIGVSIDVDFDVKEMEEFKDGILMYKIISQLEVNSSLLPKINCHPLSPADAVNNFGRIIKFLSIYKKTFPIEFLNKERELHQAKPEFILKFLMCLKRIYQNEKQFFDTISNKSRLGTSFNLSKSFTNYSLKQIVSNRKDQSQREATPLTSKARKKFIMAPQLFWA